MKTKIPITRCPLCYLVNKTNDADFPILRETDIVLQNELITVSVAAFWPDEKEGYLIVIPNNHYPTIYDTPDYVIKEMIRVTKKMSQIVKAINNCGGITIIQNNESAGGQNVNHIHIHIYPRYKDDDFYTKMAKKTFFLASLETRHKYCLKAKSLL